MARTSSKKGLATQPSPKDIALIENEMSAGAQNLAKRIGGAQGNAVKILPSGKFKMPEGLELDEINMIIVDFTNKNFFYTQRFDKDNPTPPDCYAENAELELMKPDPEAPDPQQVPSCKVCPMNVFGSGENGKSKACKNTREIVFLLADDHGSHNAADATLYTMSVPPTSIGQFDGIVLQVNRLMGSLPIKAIINVTATPVGTYAKLAFNDPVSNPDYATNWSRRAEAATILARKPDFTPRAPRNTNARPAARRAGAAPKTAARGR